MKQFVKINPIPGSESLICEAKGLRLLRKACESTLINVPQVISSDRDSLHIEQIETPISPSLEDMNLFGVELAKMHKQLVRLEYGLEYDNYIGLNKQANGQYQIWGEFFFEKRIAFQIALIKNKALKSELIDRTRSLKDFIILELNSTVQAPSLLHGDLWSGNILFNEKGPWIFDPAVYYGDPEADLAMTEMFGGFPESFYQGYRSIKRKSNNYDLKKIVYNLYHYLNHYNLFGSGYLAGVRESILSIKKSMA